MPVAYPSSWTEVCNLALGRLGTRQIISLLEGTPAANYCNQFLGEAIHEVLGEYDWRRMRKRAALARLAAVPAFGYAYTYALPSDFIRPVEVATGADHYSIEEAGLLTDAETVYLTYVYAPQEPTNVPPYLRRAFAIRLAFLLTTPLASDEALAARIAAEDKGAFGAALAADGKQSDVEIIDVERGYVFYDELR